MNLSHIELELYLLQPFLSNKTEINIEDTNNQKQFFDLAKSFQLSGYLLNSLNYSEKTMPLKKNLERLANNYLKKNLLMRYEISRIAKLFDENNIEYVVLKGIAMKIKRIDAYRQFRDLDILIAKKNLKQAYELLIASGYSYFEEKTSDSTKYIGDMHHLPPMINNAGIVIELHHRITLPILFNSCPLTNICFLEKEICDGINVPSDKVLLVHTLYHGVLHHKLNSGPMFLLDIKNILIKNQNADNSINDLLEQLDLTTVYKKAKMLIEDCNQIYRADDSLIRKFNSFFEGKKIFSKEDGSPNNRVSLLRLYRFIKYNSYYYQLPYWSPKLTYYIIKTLIKKFYA